MFSCAVTAAAQVHPPEPTVNLGDTSFLDARGGPGYLVEEIGDGTYSTQIAGGSGGVTAITPTSNSIASLTHAVWLSRFKILQAWYGVEVIAVAAHVNAGARGSSGGYGDTTVAPFILQWKEWKAGPARVQQRIVFDFDLPTGAYQRSSVVNLSGHAYTIHPYYAMTVNPATHWESSWRVHYLWNSPNNAPPIASAVRSTQAGQAVHFNATLAYGFPHGIWIGANSYYLKQVTSPAVNGITLVDSPEQVGAIGPGVLWDLKQWQFYANFYHELGAVNRTEGSKLVLRITRIGK